MKRSDLFWDAFMKQAQSDKRPTGEEVSKADKILASASAGTLLGRLGATLAQLGLGGVLMRNHKDMPSGAGGSDIKDLKKHFRQAAAKPIKSRVYNVLSKPQDARDFYRDMTPVSPETSNELREIADLGESFSKEHKLRESGIKFNARNRGKLGDYYNPLKNTVNMNTASRAVALHEMGHAADYRGRMGKVILRKLPEALAITAVPAALAYGDQIKERIPGEVDDKVITLLQENPVLTGLGGYGLATLYPEARASYSALKHVLKHRGKAEMIRDLKKSLGPAYATYLAGTLPVAAGFGLAKKYKERINEKEKKKSNRLKKTAAVKPEDLKAFAAGAAVAGIPVGLMSYYRHGTKGGNLINDIEEERLRRSLTRTYGKTIGNVGYTRAKKTNEFMERHPVGAAVATGGAVGLLAGLLTAATMKDLGVLKKVAKDEDSQGSIPLKRTVSSAGPRLAEVTEKSDSGPVNYI